MKLPSPEKRRTRISTSVSPVENVASIASTHPFTQQLDLVFPSDPTLVTALSKLETRYAKGKTTLSNVINSADVFVNSVEPESTVLMLSTNDDDDVWCIDPRGVLTLSVAKETYEQLGLLGEPLPFNNHEDQHVIHLPLQRNADSAKNLAKRKRAIEGWDKRREELWDVVYCSNSYDLNSTPDFIPEGGQVSYVPVPCERRELKDVHIPLLNIKPRPKVSKSDDDDNDVMDEWNRDAGALFEWIGLACLGSQRLSANDRVDPFVALYDPPSPSWIGNVTHLRWRGLLSPSFVQRVLEAALNIAGSSNKDASGHPSFFSVTAQGISRCPVSYIPRNPGQGKALNLPSPARLPRADGEDTWCLLVTIADKGDLSGVQCSMVESLGQWDTRWG
ncbi:hypothetical protein K443DRAFT_564736 [Laccaria amethystina LaAM-08-1]|uniref:Uncharacterized protein n=1 Tax=Laccaria amethystina LaAM-08-1 TaxID=1095629 RepID=A0A0C9X8W7_9AGAR|nr:hypothetical protein K443DRAFT_564736 [Laccaria amethystina LaAM-08-1]